MQVLATDCTLLAQSRELGVVPTVCDASLSRAWAGPWAAASVAMLQPSGRTEGMAGEQGHCPPAAVVETIAKDLASRKFPGSLSPSPEPLGGHKGAGSEMGQGCWWGQVGGRGERRLLPRLGPGTHPAEVSPAHPLGSAAGDSLEPCRDARGGTWPGCSDFTSCAWGRAGFFGQGRMPGHARSCAEGEAPAITGEIP